MDTNFLSKVDKGYDNISIVDIAIPFLQILQDLSPVCKKSEDEYNPDASPGMFYNNKTGELYGTKMQLIPLAVEKVWLEIDKNIKVVGKHSPGSIEVDQTDFTKWLNPKNGNEISESRCFYCLNAEHIEEGILIFPLKSSGIKHAKEWMRLITNTRLENGELAPFYSSVWELKTVLNKNDKGSWFSVGINKSNIKRLRFIKQEEYDKEIVRSLSYTKELMNITSDVQHLKIIQPNRKEISNQSQY